MLTSICGINWGDEGKGRMVDLLSEDYNIVCRYQGGNNAGHTVVNDLGKFALNLLPSGILRKKVVNVLGNGMVIDLKHLCGEMDKLRSAGVEITPENLKISDRAVITMPYNVWKKIASLARNSVPPAAVSRPCTPINIIKRRSEWANCSIKNTCTQEWRTSWSGRTSPLWAAITPNP